MKTQKIRITAKEEIMYQFGVHFMGIKVAIAHETGGDAIIEDDTVAMGSEAIVGYNAVMIKGSISKTKKNWYCIISEGTVFELEVDKQRYEKYKSYIERWEIEEIKEFSKKNDSKRRQKYISDYIE